MKIINSLADPEISSALLNGAQALDSEKINTDMSATWKILGIGYGMKSHDGNPCHVCPIQDKDVDAYNAVKCTKWCSNLRNGDEQVNCYHQHFLDKTTIQKFRNDLQIVREELQPLLDRFQEVKEESFINISEDPREPLAGVQRDDNESIHFDILMYASDTSSTLQYESLLHHDLKLRNLSTSGGILDCQQRLKEHLIKEYNYKVLSAAISHVDRSGSDKEFILLENCPPCILHMEMRTILKFLQIILHDGLSNAVDDKTKNAIEVYIRNINNTFNETIFGTKTRPYTFSVSYDSSKKNYRKCNVRRRALSHFIILVFTIIRFMYKK
jgi:hypothetical protein